MTRQDWYAIPCPQGFVRHHVITEQAVRRAHGDLFDPRNCLVLHWKTHLDHHAGKPLPLSRVPDSAISFAVETLGIGPAVNELRRRYAGSDARVEALAEAWAMSDV